MSSSRPQEHSVLIALRELDSLEQQRRDREAAEARARAEAEARALAERIARERAAAELRQRAADAAEAELAAERARQDHELRLRSAEIEAAVRAEQALRMQQVQAELDAQLQLRAGRERGGQRLLAAGVLGALGLVGALGAMFLTQQPRLAVVPDTGAREHDIAVQEASAAIEAMRRELGQMRSDNAREQALLDAAAALLPGTPPPVAAVVATPKPTRPRPPRVTEPAPKPPRIKVCKNLDDPLAEDC
jgi:multidrug efflux pump subunit AcrA (membrane-fusion protein)